MGDRYIYNEYVNVVNPASHEFAWWMVIHLRNNSDTDVDWMRFFYGDGM